MSPINVRFKGLKAELSLVAARREASFGSIEGPLAQPLNERKALATSHDEFSIDEPQVTDAEILGAAARTGLQLRGDVLIDKFSASREITGPDSRQTARAKGIRIKIDVS